jgi:hypothetical protein
MLGHPVVSILASLLLVHLHMLWTHTMIAHPPTKPLLQCIIPHAPCKPLILLTFVYAAT